MSTKRMRKLLYKLGYKQAMNDALYQFLGYLGHTQFTLTERLYYSGGFNEVLNKLETVWEGNLQKENSEPLLLENGQRIKLEDASTL